jgi:hypothetical protein
LSDRELTVGVVFNDEKVLDEYLRPSIAAARGTIRAVELDNVGNAVTTNIASLYNVLLAVAGPDVVALLHPDIAFDANFVEDVYRTVATLERRGQSWGALGIVGRSWTGEYVWCHEVEEPVRVCSLDSCSLITRRSLGIRFDQKRFDEFHCYVEDYCLESQAHGHDVFVLPAHARHGSATKSVKGSQWGKYKRYRRRLGWKWRRRFGRVYTC